jgi:hypothetical protein
MPRPRPCVLTESVNKTTYQSQQILSSQGIWAVFYEGQPINIKSQNLLVNYPGPRYKKSAFSNPGHAIGLARRLNDLHRTDKFSVVLMNQGQQVYP